MINLRKRLSNKELKKLIRERGAEEVLNMYLSNKINILETQIQIILDSREESKKGHGGVNTNG